MHPCFSWLTCRSVTMAIGLFALTTALSPALVSAQHGFLLKINPLSLFAGTANVQAETGFGGRWTFQTGAFGGGISTDPADTEVTKLRFRWISATTEAHFYPGFQGKSAPEGFYMGGYLRFRYSNSKWAGKAYDPDADAVNPSQNTYSVAAFGIGGIMGYQFLVKEKISIELFGGPQFMVGRPSFKAECITCNGNERNAHPQGPDFTGLEVRAGASLGYFFGFRNR